MLPHRAAYDRQARDLSATHEFFAGGLVGIGMDRRVPPAGWHSSYHPRREARRVSIHEKIELAVFSISVLATRDIAMSDCALDVQLRKKTCGCRSLDACLAPGLAGARLMGQWQINSSSHQSAGMRTCPSQEGCRVASRSSRSPPPQRAKRWPCSDDGPPRYLSPLLKILNRLSPSSTWSSSSCPAAAGRRRRRRRRHPPPTWREAPRPRVVGASGTLA